MRLYHSPFAPNARRVRMFLAEKGLELPLVPVDLAKLEQRSEDYNAVNPFQVIPALELDDGSVISESIAICRYLEELHPQPALFGTTPRERAEIEMWQRLAEFQLLFTIAQTFRHTHPAMREMENPQVPGWADSSRAKAMTAMRRFDRALASRRFLAGERFSVADITGLIAMDFTKPARIVVPDELVNLRRWRDEVGARPSAKA
ncbi:MAG TPA: glutathione S-transferase [Roseiarcus sp.]|nr:glutathione S-transferase [Roseiarcus sp.]